ncbi:MAG: hypothetical protein U1F66_12685 [bacterium]
MAAPSPLSSANDALEPLQGFARAHYPDRPQLQAELSSLRRETDPQLLEEALYGFAQTQEREGRIDLAAQTYQLAASPRAERRLAALQGRGPLGERLELLGRNFARQASDPAMLSAMALGGLAFQTTRLAVLSRLAASPTASFLTRGLGARAFAWGAGFSLEFPTFTLAARGIHQAMGDSQDWSARALGRDLLSSGLTLFLLKGCSAGGSGLVRRIQNGAAAEGLFARFSAAAIPQAAAFTGILGSHLLEARLGLRPQTDGANALLDSLATLLQFHVGGRILRQATGGAYEARLETLSRLVSEAPSLRRLPPMDPGLAWASPELRPALHSQEVFPPKGEILAMSIDGPKDPPPPNAFPRGSEPPRSFPAPVQVNPALFLAIRNRFSRLEAELFTLYEEQPGETLWAHQSHREALELTELVDLIDRHLPAPADRAILREIRGELEWSRRLLAALAKAEDLPGSGDEEVRRFIGALYRVPNKAVNYLNSGNPHDLSGSLRNAVDARQILYGIYRPYQMNFDAWDPAWASEARLPARLSVDPSDPQRELHVPHYDYRDEHVSPFLEIPGTGRKVVLVGEVPLERMALGHHHRLEVVPANHELRGRLALAAAENGRLDRTSIIFREWKRYTRDADYVEAYDIGTAAQFVSREGELLLQDLVLDRIRPGGVAFLVSRDPQALQRIVQIASEKQWADVIAGSFRGHLPVEVDRPDQSSGNFVFLRKLPQL